MRTGMSALALLLALALAPAASASQIIDRNATGVRLTVDRNGRAVVSYRAGGRTRHVLASGAVNAQVRFNLDYSGGRGAWSSITACPRYDGPPLAWRVAACKAPDGTYWAVQSWQRVLPGLGYKPWTAKQRVWEIHLSHWSGPLPQLEMYVDWIYGGKYHHLFGRYTYRGKPVHGNKTTTTGVPLDPYGRNIYLDVLNSSFRRGWARMNAFVSHKPLGTFCYGFFPRRSYYDSSTRPPGYGERYRATSMGPGVSPDVTWEHAGLGAFDPKYEADMNALQDVLMAGDKLCRQH